MFPCAMTESLAGARTAALCYMSPVPLSLYLSTSPVTPSAVLSIKAPINTKKYKKTWTNIDLVLCVPGFGTVFSSAIKSEWKSHKRLGSYSNVLHRNTEFFEAVDLFLPSTDCLSLQGPLCHDELGGTLCPAGRCQQTLHQSGKDLAFCAFHLSHHYSGSGC